MLVSKILATLPEQYRYFASAWESTSEKEKTLENLTARLLLEETRGKEDKENPVAFKASERKCYRCKKSGHLTKDCKSKNGNKRKCFNCNKYGHMAKSCREKKSKSNEACSICKKTNHQEKDCYF